MTDKKQTIGQRLVELNKQKQLVKDKEATEKTYNYIVKKIEDSKGCETLVFCQQGLLTNCDGVLWAELRSRLAREDLDVEMYPMEYTDKDGKAGDTVHLVPGYRIFVTFPLSRAS